MAAPTGRNARNYTGGSTAASLLQHFEGATITPAVCWKVTTKDGATVLGFTSHTRDLADLTGHPGVTFKSAQGLTPSTAEANSGLSVPNLEVDAILSAAAITESDILKGRWDYASFEVFIVNYKDLTMGDLVAHSGRFGEIKLLDERFRAEGVGLNQATQAQIGNLTRPECRVQDFADAQCGFTLVDGTHRFTTATLVDGGGYDNKHFLTSAAPGAGFTFANGKAKFTGGALDGETIEIKSWDAVTGRIDLKLGATSTIANGQSVTLTIGCDRKPATCSAFSPTQIKRIRCEPHVPGLEKVHKINS